MGKREQIMELIDRLIEIPAKKTESIENQRYEDAQRLRNEQRTLLGKLDEVSGVDGFYNKVFNTEKVLQHLEILVNSTEELKKLRPNFNEVFEDSSIFDKSLISLYKQRDEAYLAVLQIREIIK
tara:strand:+ start:377 stop:748 length:372 start_codon:yes stop_codon:yes gene_type:complete